MTRPTGRTLAVALGTAPQDGATVAALRLAEAAVQRGHRVTVYAYGAAAEVAAHGTPTGPLVEALLRQGVHGGLTAWVVDEASAQRCPRAGQVGGVVMGDGGDLWRFVETADVALGVAV